MERANSKRGRKTHEVYIGGELIRNAPKDPKDIALLILERRTKKTQAAYVRAKIAADQKKRGIQ